MKLKTFLNVCNAVTVRYNVFSVNAEGQEDVKTTFTVDYIKQDVETLNKNILKRFDLVGKGADVRYVDVIGGIMSVDVVIKEG